MRTTHALASSMLFLLVCCGGRIGTTASSLPDSENDGGEADAASGVALHDADTQPAVAGDASAPVHPGKGASWSASYVGEAPRFAHAADGSILFTANEYGPTVFDNVSFTGGPALVKLDPSHKAAWAVEPFHDNARAWTVTVDTAGEAYLSHLLGGARKFSGGDGRQLWDTAIQGTSCTEIATANGRVTVGCQVNGGAATYPGADGGSVTLPGFLGIDLLVASLDAQTGAVLWANDLGTGGSLEPMGIAIAESGDVFIAALASGGQLRDVLGSPTLPVSVDGTLGSGGLVAKLDAATGRVAWIQPQPFPCALGYSETGGLAIAVSNVGVAYLNRATGATAWSAPDPDINSLAVNASGDVVTLSSMGSTNLRVARYSSAGHVTWTADLAATGAFSYYTWPVAALPGGQILLGGQLGAPASVKLTDNAGGVSTLTLGPAFILALDP